jgi:SnoaL-like domain
MNLEERVALLEARNELSDLVARYCHLIDGRDFAGASELFDEDASFTVPDERTTGRDAVRAFLQTQLERYEFTYHYVHSQVIDAIEGDRAHGVVDAHAEHGEDGTCVLAGIRYVDAYRRASASAVEASRRASSNANRENQSAGSFPLDDLPTVWLNCDRALAPSLGRDMLRSTRRRDRHDW